MDVSNPSAKVYSPQLLGGTLTIGEKQQLGTFDSLAGKDEAGKTDTQNQKVVWTEAIYLVYGKATSIKTETRGQIVFYLKSDKGLTQYSQFSKEMTF